MEYPFLLCLAMLLFMSSVATGQSTELPTTVPGSMETGQSVEPPVIMPHPPFFQVGPDAVELSLSDGDYETIQLQQPFIYAGKTYSRLYLSMDGYVAFNVPVVDDELPNPQLGKDIIAPLWTDLDADEGGRWTYEQATSGPLIDEATNVIYDIEPSLNFSASWVFVSTWENVPLEITVGAASLQVVLVSNAEGFAFILMNYGVIPSIPSPYWLAGYEMENSDFITISVNDSSELSSASNINFPGRWAFQGPFRPLGPPAPPHFYPFWYGNEVNFFLNNGSSSQITLQQPFQFFGSYEYTIYVNKNGVLSFSEPLGETSPDNNINISTDLIAALWTDFEIDYSSRVIYQEVTSGPLLFRATQDINMMFPENPFYATWLFIATWQMMPFANSTGNATFQAVLVSNAADTSYVMLNYGEIDSTDQSWLAGYEAVDGRSSFIPEEDTFNLSSSSNVQIPGCWVFQVTDPVSSICQFLNCAWGEVCTQINGAYGCACGESSPRPNPETYDAMETCSGSSGSLSLSRCQLFEAGYPSDVLHLNDPSCRGLVQYDRLVFNFDSNVKMCGTILEHNETHIIFKNSAGTTDGMGVISHVGGLNIAFSCVYPLIQSISMPMAFQATGSTISKELSTEGTYQISMIAYPDLTFQNPFSGNVTLEMNQQLYISVQVDKFDSSQIALVLDNCWATPVNQMDYNIRWDLITNECPNPADSTVEVLQNGVSTFSYFSFRMFTFTGFANSIYLHCQVHLCVQGSGNCALPCDRQLARRRRSADFYDSAAITMEF
ncbi:alpha-tectorin-like [Hemibagrus wyckioides]|nr:alpha-tectorin-like [Hemibagrus wyckioides]